MRITKIVPRQILDSRGLPTVEVDLHLGNQVVRASAPSGASTGKHEARELRDKQKAFHGKGVEKAVANIKQISKHLLHKDPTNQEEIDNLLINLDDTKSKSKIGANTLTALSIAVCKAGAVAQNIPLYKHIQFLSKTKQPTIPIPSFNIINGGKHADTNLAIQEYMVFPTKAKSFKQALQMGAEINQTLKKILQKKYGKQATNIGDEGGFVPPIDDINIPFKLLTQAINQAGYKGKVQINIDAAASSFYKKGNYWINNQQLSTTQLTNFYQESAKNYPLASIEDPFHEEDFKAFANLNKLLKKVQIVGDDLTVTNKERIAKALALNSCNALLVKINQIGTITETLKAINLARRRDWNIMISHRSGETNDSFIADFAVGTGAGQIKAGAPVRGERLAKYNQLLRIEESAKIKYAKF